MTNNNINNYETFPIMSLTASGVRHLNEGSLWVWRGEARHMEAEAGMLVRCVDERGKDLGGGFFNPKSNIIFRWLGSQADFEQGLPALFQRRLELALRLREATHQPSSGRRLVFAEADGLSGLIVDQYSGALIIQNTCLGLEPYLELIAQILTALTKADVVLARSDMRIREKEGLELKDISVLYQKENFDLEKLKTWDLDEGGLNYTLDLWAGHKTGFFIDQRDSRAQARLAAAAVKGDWLDCYCYSGGFALNLAKGGAHSVLGLDQSEEAIALAAQNAQANKLESIARFEKAQLPQRLKDFEKEGLRFDGIVLDPPSFAKGASALQGALRGYREINLRALRLLKPGGLLLTASCTQAVDEDRFLSIIVSAAKDSNCRLREWWRGGQPADHPRNPAMLESRYLKAFLFEKI